MKYFLAVTLIFLVFELSQQYNPRDYCNLYGLHSACRFTTFGSNCKSPRQAIPTDADKKAIVDWHNSVREKAASGMETGAKDGTLPKGSNMRKLVWDDELAYIAQAWANNCTFAHDSYQARAVLNGRFNAVGQNGAGYGTTGSLTVIDFVQVIKPWYTSEVGHLPKSVISSFNANGGSGTIGHYTQVIWANTKAVGCGGTIHNDGTYTWIHVFCNYGEAGNYGGQTVYKTGTPCSACPNGTSCSGSLCA